MTNSKLALKAQAETKSSESLAEASKSNSILESHLQTDTAVQDYDAHQTYIDQVLSELDYLKHKEKRVDPESVEELEAKPSLQKALPNPVLKAPTDKLLGILGHCTLRGHIAHFYNLRSEIERHIKTVSELGDERFVLAYNYLKAHPSTEAIFVYETKMVAANRINGRLIQKEIISY